MKKMIIAVATLAAAILVLGLFRVIRQENSPKETERKNEETERKSEETERKNEETDSKNEEAKETVPTYQVLKTPNMKGLWLSQFDMEKIYTDAATGRQRSRKDFEARVEGILDNVVSLGVNTLVVQTRPFGDSLYPSDVYPMSSFAVGAYGRQADYDAFAIILRQAHARSLAVHAWINPLRAMKTEEIALVEDRYAIKQWYKNEALRGRILVEVGGRLYLNPAYEETTQLICAGVSELLQRYDVDGIHMDDYFYPTTEASFDAEAYAAYRRDGGTRTLAEFRRENVTRMVKAIYDTVKKEKPEVPFGISPAGVMKNNYNKLYADVGTWCSGPGYVDYICPQVYFGLEHDTYAFDRVCRTFSDLIGEGGPSLIIGMTLGKAVSEYDPYAGSGKYEWRDHKNVLSRSLAFTQSIEKCRGVCLFCYQYLFDPLTGKPVEATAEEMRTFLPLFRSITWE